MRNLFLHPETWGQLTNIDVSPEFAWTLSVEGSYSSDENSHAAHWNVEPGDVLRGAVSYAVHRADSWSDTDLWFLVIQSSTGIVVFSERLLSYGEEASSGSFELDIDAHATGGFELGVSYSESGIWAPYGYSGLGTITISPPIPPPPPPPRPRGHVYELDRGWSFDGMYIPHFLELNWYFGDDPFTDKTIQKVRIHGLAKGRTQLQLAVAGMQHEYDSDYTEPQFIDLPRNAAFISTDYIPTTNYVDSSNWGVSLQLKFEGRNCDLMRPEPSHVLQVLALQGSPQENGRRIN